MPVEADSIKVVHVWPTCRPNLMMKLRDVSLVTMATEKV